MTSNREIDEGVPSNREIKARGTNQRRKDLRIYIPKARPTHIWPTMLQYRVLVSLN